MKSSYRFHLLAAIALSLSSCSGGGGPTIATPPPSPPAPAPPPPAPAAFTPISGSTFSYPADNQLVPTNVLTAQRAGYIGSAVKVGILDSGVNTSIPSLNGRVAWFNSYLAQGNSTPDQNNLSAANDPLGHGTIVTALLGGYAQGTYDNTSGPVNYFAGGVAPGSQMYVAQICDSTGSCTLYSKPYQDLMANGVHLFNQSLGENVSTFATAADAQSASEQVGALLSPFGTSNLYVWAAGNDPATSSDISVDAEVPKYTPSLQPQWLSVANVDINGSGQVSGLDPTSNACGVTEQWCLSAPGYDQVPIVSGTSFDTGFAVGTSLSTPIVTGVAALIWQKFPWFTPANVTDTILTTATPLGSGPYPNTTYGWGLVNATAALNGPAQLAFGSFVANIGTYDSTFANNISGSGSLTLDGSSGILTLSGDDTYSGGTTVNSGSLALTGSLAGNVTVSGGSFGGDGTVSGTVDNSGGTVVSESSAAGQGLIVGNYSASSSSTTAIAIGNPLTVAGAASLAGTFKALAPPKTYTPSATEAFINASSVAGTFSSQTYGAGVYYIVGPLAYSATQVTATVTTSSVAQATAAMPNATPVAVAAAAGVQNSLQQVNTWTAAQAAAHPTFMRAVGTFMASPTDLAAVASLNSLSGEIYPTLHTLAVGQVMTMQGIIEDKARQPLTGFGPSVWLRYFGAFGVSRQAGTDAAHYSDNGFVGGFDTRLAHDLAGGLAVSHDRSDVSLDGLGGRSYGDINMLSAYARFGHASGPYLSGVAAYGWNNSRVDRSTLVGSRVYPVYSVPSGTIGVLAAETGYSYRAWTPFLGFTAVRLRQAAITETGGDGLNLSMPSFSPTFGFVTMGLRHTRTLPIFGYLVSATADFTWRYSAYGNSASPGAFAATPTALFRIIGQNLPKNMLNAGVTLHGQLSDAWSWTASCRARYAPSGFVAAGIHAGLTAQF